MNLESVLKCVIDSMDFNEEASKLRELADMLRRVADDADESAGEIEGVGLNQNEAKQ